MGLFDSALLIFTVPAFLALAFWLLGLLGLFHFDALDGDLHGLHGGVLDFAGFGLVPVSVVVSLLLFFFGWTGIGLHVLADDLLKSMDLSDGTGTILFLLPALLVAFFASAGTARLVRPLFDDYGKAQGASELVGRMAVINSSEVSPSFGSAEVRPLNGVPIEIAVRTSGDSAARYGDRVLIIDYDPAHGTYTVEPYDPLTQPSSDDLDQLALR